MIVWPSTFLGLSTSSKEWIDDDEWLVMINRKDDDGYYYLKFSCFFLEMGAALHTPTQALHHWQRDCGLGSGSYSQTCRQLHGSQYLCIVTFFLICKDDLFCCLWLKWNLFAFCSELNSSEVHPFPNYDSSIDDNKQDMRIAGFLCVQCLRWWHWIRPWLLNVGAPFCGLWQEEQDFLYSLVLPTGGHSCCRALQYSNSNWWSVIVVSCHSSQFRSSIQHAVEFLTKV